MTTELPVKADSMTVVSKDAFDEMMNNAVHKAKRIAQIINNQKLFTEIGPKKHLDYEAWVTTAASYGARPSIEWTKDLLDEDGTFMGCLARACLMDMATGTKFSFVEHVCTREESSWANRDRYAIVSMAETRAASKACRMAFAWVIVLAGEGFATTPSEEMIDKKQNDKKAPDTRVISEPQVGRMYRIATQAGWSRDAVVAMANSRGFDKPEQISRDKYEEICKTLEVKAPPQVQPQQQTLDK